MKSCELIVLFSFRTVGSGKAMKLGSKSKDVDSFVDKLRSEGTGEDSKQYKYRNNNNNHHHHHHHF